MSPWSIVPRCPRVLQGLPTMSGSSQVSQLSQSQLPDIVGSPCNTLGQRGTMLQGDTVPCPKGQSCIVWTDLNIRGRVPPHPLAVPLSLTPPLVPVPPSLRLPPHPLAVPLSLTLPLVPVPPSLRLPPLVPVPPLFDSPPLYLCPPLSDSPPLVPVPPLFDSPPA